MRDSVSTRATGHRLAGRGDRSQGLHVDPGNGVVAGVGGHAGTSLCVVAAEPGLVGVGEPTQGLAAPSPGEGRAVHERQRARRERRRVGGSSAPCVGVRQWPEHVLGGDRRADEVDVVDERRGSPSWVNRSPQNSVPVVSSNRTWASQPCGTCGVVIMPDAVPAEVEDLAVGQRRPAGRSAGR